MTSFIINLVIAGASFVGTNINKINDTFEYKDKQSPKTEQTVPIDTSKMLLNFGNL